MLNAEEELIRLRPEAEPRQLPEDGFVEVLRIRADDPDDVAERARGVLRVVISGRADGAGHDSAFWVQRLPDWFVAACSSPQSPEERAAWLARWRALDRAGKAQAEADLGWTLTDWLDAVDTRTRPWRWWGYEGGRVLAVVDGWPAPLDPLAWLLTVAGAASVELVSGK
jgi:hypothetical protein